MAKILVIDDEEPVRKLIQEMLEFAGYEIRVAEGGRDGVALARSWHPDLILCDVTMPGLDGFGTLTAIRGNSQTALIPFIFLTGQSGKEAVRQGMASGADDYLTKPFNVEDLLAAVKARLERTSIVQQQSELRMQELRGKIVHMLPHELRTPLQGILGFADILVDEYETLEREQIGEMARYISHAGSRLRRLIENFLVFAQLEVTASSPERITDLRRTSVALNEEEFEGMLEDVPELANRKEDLSIWLEECELAVSAPDLHKLVTEVLDNAAKFSEKGAPIEVAGQVEDGKYCLSVVDFGRGMTPEQIESIGAYNQFERQVYEQQGTGLGLTIAQRLCELYDGSMSIESTPGEMTTVELRLPLAVGSN